MSAAFEVAPLPLFSAATEFVRGLKDPGLDARVIADSMELPRRKVDFDSELAQLASVLTGADASIQACNRVQELKSWMIHVLSMHTISRRLQQAAKMDAYTTGVSVRHSLIRIALIAAENPVLVKGALRVLVDSVQMQFINTDEVARAISQIVADGNVNTRHEGRFRIFTGSGYEPNN